MGHSRRCIYHAEPALLSLLLRLPYDAINRICGVVDIVGVQPSLFSSTDTPGTIAYPGLRGLTIDILPFFVM